MRECNCPEWVIRCAHWGDEILVLVNMSIGLSHPHWQPRDGKGFNVALAGQYRPCLCHGTTSRSRQNMVTTLHATEDEAKAEFYKREAQLLEGAAASKGID